MITFSNIQRYDNKNFVEYLESPGKSFSFIKKNHYGVKFEMKETDKMILGTLVDKVMTAPHEAQMLHPMYGMAKNIAAKIQERFPYLIHFDKQVSFSAITTCGEFSLPVKGRLDYLLPNSMVIDLKISQSRNINSVIRHFEYNDQLWVYSKLAKVPKGYLMIYSVPLETTTIVEIDVSSDHSNFWAGAITTFGKVKEKQTI